MRILTANTLVAYHAGSNHVQIDVDQTAEEMIVYFDGCGMIAVFPEGAFTLFPAIEFQTGSASDKLYALGNHFRFTVDHQQVDMI